MIGAALLLVLQATGADSIVVRSGVVVDAVHGAPVSDAVLRTAGADARSGPDGRFTLVVSPHDTVRVARIGYREWVVPAAALAPGTLVVRLARLAVPLQRVDVRAQEARIAAITRQAAELRTEGATTAADVARALPFVSARTTSSRSAFSIRGSRAEQVVVTLDGIPLNDPATGIADPSDLPLGVIGSATVIPGSDAARHGSGASGGVIAFNSASRELLAASAGSHGARAVEAAWPARLGPLTVRTGAAWSTVSNDFEFRNAAAAPPADTLERRVNADVTRRALFASVLAPRVQLLALATETERGLAGPMNARDFDDDRGRTRRMLARVLTSAGRWEAALGARTLGSRYRDPPRPYAESDVSAVSADADLATSAWGIALRGGGGVDRVSGTGIAFRSRPRLFASAARELAVRGVRIDGAARVDHVRDAGTHVSPSVAVAADGPVTLSARAARGFRIPTFFDLYLSTPQRVFARELRPERVTSDLELRADASYAAPAATMILAGGSVFARRTLDAVVWFPGNIGWSPHNVPVERVRGAEVYMGVEHRRWRADAWTAAYDARLWDGYLETRTPYVPYVAGGAGASWTHGGTIVRAGVRFTGRRLFTNGPALPELELPASAVARLSLAHTVRLRTTSLTLHGGLNDLTNVRAEEIRRYPSPGRTFSAGLVLQPHPPR